MEKNDYFDYRNASKADQKEIDRTIDRLEKATDSLKILNLITSLNLDEINGDYRDRLALEIFFDANLRNQTLI